MSITMRTEPVVSFNHPATGPMRQMVDTLQRVLGKTTSIGEVGFIRDLAGYQIINAAISPGTDIPELRTVINFADAGIDQVRVVVRGKNSAAGSVTVQVYRITGGATIASATVTDGTAVTFQGAWTVLVPTGADEEIGLRVVGDGVFDPTFYRVDLQMRTLRAVA